MREGTSANGRYLLFRSRGLFGRFGYSAQNRDSIAASRVEEITPLYTKSYGCGRNSGGRINKKTEMWKDKKRNREVSVKEVFAERRWLNGLSQRRRTQQPGTVGDQIEKLISNNSDKGRRRSSSQPSMMVDGGSQRLII